MVRSMSFVRISNRVKEMQRTLETADIVEDIFLIGRNSSLKNQPLFNICQALDNPTIGIKILQSNMLSKSSP